jgi:hypothetical protein
VDILVEVWSFRWRCGDFGHQIDHTSTQMTTSPPK